MFVSTSRTRAGCVRYQAACDYIHMNTRIISAVAILALIALPSAASAQVLYCPQITRSLSRGMQGNDVAGLQRFLVESKILAAGSATGYYGALTETAVKLYQYTREVVRSGTPQTTGYGSVGIKTRIAILSECVKANASVTPKPTPVVVVPKPTTPVPVVVPRTGSGAAIEITTPRADDSYVIGDTITLNWLYSSPPPNSQVVYRMKGVEPETAAHDTAGVSPQAAGIGGYGNASWQTGANFLNTPGRYQFSALLRQCDPSGCSVNTTKTNSANLVTYASSTPVQILITRTKPGKLTLGTVQTLSVSMAYEGMPERADVMVIDQNTGLVANGTSIAYLPSTSGTLTIALPSSLLRGTYYLKAVDRTTLTLVAQTVFFTAGN